MEGFVDVRALANLLCSNEDDDQNFDDKQKVRPYAKKKDELQPKIVREKEAKAKPEPKKFDVEEYFEKNAEAEDWRKTPEWCVAYKQKVTPSDMFLQMSGKTGLTSSCEDMIITINLPGEQSRSIDVRVTETQLELTSPLYRLCVPLPHPVDPKKGNAAKWYPEEEQLKLTLTMEREFDYINF